ncbi:YSIRK-type signal peptide-containing protein [Limosilactobacillus oris]|uniref:YSIRK-type signal peptide-containing protein n=1 Tax=Limosilactobacillus oris TaxID=1632 RepID=UPI003D18B8A3
MVSRNNQWYKLQQGMEQVPHFGIRKLTVGVSSVLLGLSFMAMVVRIVSITWIRKAAKRLTILASCGSRVAIIMVRLFSRSIRQFSTLTRMQMK